MPDIWKPITRDMLPEKLQELWDDVYEAEASLAYAKQALIAEMEASAPPGKVARLQWRTLDRPAMVGYVTLAGSK